LRPRTDQTEQTHTPRRWLVLAAWPPELTELRRLLRKSEMGTLKGFPYPPAMVRGEQSSPAPHAIGNQVILRAAGVGLVEAAIGATAAIAEVKPDAVMFIGTAGSYPGRRPDLALAGVVAARRLVLSADGVATGNAYLPPALPATQETTMALRRIAAAAGLLMADVACPLAITSRPVPVGRGARSSACDVENLEAFAVGRAAATAGLPFAAILGISNAVGPSAHAAWKRNATRAAAAACRAAFDVIERSSG
jgi:nucleoside phosphorylase